MQDAEVLSNQVAMKLSKQEHLETPTISSVCVLPSKLDVKFGSWSRPRRMDTKWFGSRIVQKDTNFENRSPGVGDQRHLYLLRSLRLMRHQVSCCLLDRGKRDRRICQARQGGI
jgi:hypothetical protein